MKHYLISHSLLFALLVSICTSPVSAATANAGFDTANNLYSQGKFAAAAAAYEKLLPGGPVSSALYFNLGNAQFKAGELGQAIAAYRQAEQLAPRDPDVRANLQFARNHAGNVASVKPGLAQRALSRLTLDEWTRLAATAVSGWFILLALGQWRPAWRAALWGCVLLAGLAAILFIAGTAADRILNPAGVSAVVITPEATVRTGPLDDAQTSFTARDGAELTVLDEREDWLQVVNGARQSGSVKRAAVKVL